MRSEVKKDERGIQTLFVDGKPFFAYSGEIHNSSASSLAFLEEKVWKNLRGLHMNSVIVPVYWEAIEAKEGEYDFALVDGLIDQARKEGLRLILLWFGLWKNAESMYVPGWMKRDTKTYFRVQKANGDAINTISPLCEAAVQKDKQAFTALMRHIREFDEEAGTVIMMQVENEIGILGSACDYSQPAREAFTQEIPAVLSENCGVSGTWREAFGIDAEESFMAYYFAKAVEEITEAGQKEYPLPCYVNSWLKQHPWYPGSYPSGGSVPGMHTIWKAAAPSLFAFGPDIYVPYCADIIDEYAYEGNPLVIPEIRKDAVSASYCLYAFAAKNAICYSPFGIEELAMDPEEIDKPPMEVMIALNIDPSAFDITGSKDYLAATYQLLHHFEPVYLKYRGTEQLKSFVRHSDTDFGTFFRFSKYDIAVSYAPKAAAKPLAAGVIVELSEDRFLLMGMMFSVTFMAKPGEDKRVDFIKMEEGELCEGEWKAGRVLNGDEKMALKFADMPGCYMVELYQY